MPFSISTVRVVCSVEGCCGLSVAKGVCDKHYRRLIRNGTLEQQRPKDWGSRESHPLYGRWAWYKRSKKIGLTDVWRKDFWKFVSDVGSPPGEDYRLVQLRKNEPLGVDNFEWRMEITKGMHSEEKKQYLRDWINEDRKNNPDKYKDKGLRKFFGIGLTEYNEKHSAQQGLCAICGNEETTRHVGKDTPKNLAVDHNHATGQIRGLLCRGCNQGIGNFKEDLQRLKKAVAYLESYIP